MSRLPTPLRLRDGDRMKQPEFHRRYESYPEDQKFELVGGTVHMASPLRRPHSDYDHIVGMALGLYALETMGTHVLHNATIILGEESEPQPDLALCLLPEYGGNSHTTPEQYVKGPPELVVEIAHSTKALDLRAKRADYKRAGVLEYLVVCVEDAEMHWFDFRRDHSIRPGHGGICRSRAFPGLWLDTAALLQLETKQVCQTIQSGLASKAHAAFVRRLARRAKKSP